MQSQNVKNLSRLDIKNSFLIIKFSPFDRSACLKKMTFKGNLTNDDTVPNSSHELWAIWQTRAITSDLAQRREKSLSDLSKACRLFKEDCKGSIRGAGPRLRGAHERSPPKTVPTRSSGWLASATRSFGYHVPTDNAADKWHVSPALPSKWQTMMALSGINVQDTDQTRPRFLIIHF